MPSLEQAGLVAGVLSGCRGAMAGSQGAYVLHMLILQPCAPLHLPLLCTPSLLGLRGAAITKPGRWSAGGVYFT